MILFLLACTAPAGDPVGDDTAPADDTGSAGCPEGEIVDGDTCVPAACGAGRWGALAVDADTVYVDAATGADGGDGSAEAPFASVQAGIELAAERDGALVAIAAGTYEESLSMGLRHDGVTLAGRCQELVTLTGADGGEPTLMVLSSGRLAGVALRGVTVTGGGNSGVTVANMTLEMADATVQGNKVAGMILAYDATVTLDRVAVTGNLPTSRGDYGRGLDVQSGAQVTATASSFDGNTELGVFVWGEGSSLTIQDSTVSDTLSGERTPGGPGVGVDDGASLVLTRVAVLRSSGAGLLATNGGYATLVDTEISETAPIEAGVDGYGMAVHSGAHVVATGCTLRANTVSAVYADEEGTTVELEGGTLAATAADAALGVGRGISAQHGAVVVARGVTIEDNVDAGVFVGGAGAAVELDDTVVARTLPRADGAGGYGALAQDGATLTLRGTTVEDNADVGLLAYGAGSVVSVTDSVVSRTRTRVDGSYGLGLAAWDGGTVTADRLRLEANHAIGALAALPGSTVTLRDSDVVGTLRGWDAGFAMGATAQLDGRLIVTGGSILDTEGPGVAVFAGGAAEVGGAELGRNAYAGALLTTEGSALTLDGVHVYDTAADAELGGGFGVHASGGWGPPTLTVVDSAVDAHAYAAVWLDGAGAYTLDGNDLAGGDAFQLGVAPVHGNAVFAERGVTAWDGSAGLRIVDNRLYGAEEVAVLLRGASASLAANRWEGNTTDVWQQACTDIEPLTAADTAGAAAWEVCPSGNLLVDAVIRFETLYLPEIDLAE